ncbi:LytR/AlgR family response regulator transcription factor [Bacteroidota bacterium]
MKNNIKTIIIDDEKLARDIIKDYLKKHESIEIVAECKNGFEGLKAITDLRPQLVFLDIQMPKITGFEMLELIENPPEIIFTTAFDQYAIKAFEVNAIDYLLKPYSVNRFNEALNRAIGRIVQGQNLRREVNTVMNRIDNRDEYIDRIVVKKNNNIILIPVNDIIYFEAQDDYVKIVTKEQLFLKNKTMKYFESCLDPKNYLRVHRSYIINISYIQKIELFEKESYKVILKNNLRLPISKTGYSNLKNILS